MKFESENKFLNTFNFSSLTDIVLLLLIFFLLSSTFIIQSGIKVQLPESETTESASNQGIIISITGTGETYLNDRKVEINELPVLLANKLENSDDKVVIINADKDTSLGRTVEIMDIAKKAGATKFHIATERI
ncbi:ExbD/TolR family protein [candidate division KSB1 bacterium]